MNITSIIAIVQIIIGAVALFFPAIGINSSVASGLIALGLSTLGISQKIASQNVGNVGNVW
jgi:hypothetical protein